MANYPTSATTFATRSAGQSIASAHMNAVQDEIAAIEAALVTTGLAHHLKFVDATYDIGQSGATRPRDLYLSRNAVIGGTLGVTGVTTMAALSATTIAGGVITISLDADTNDWAPAGLSGASVIGLTDATANRTITGLTGGADGRVMLICNRSGFSYLFPSEDAGSTAANRFRTGNSATVTMRTNGSILAVYTGTRWFINSV